MYNLKVEGSFSSAHNLKAYKGKCEELHGHNWRVEISVSSAKLDKIGMVMDFQELKARLYEVLEQLDHRYLNRMPYFKNQNPTSEKVAKYIYDCLRPKIKILKSVTVWENNASCATYEK